MIATLKHIIAERWTSKNWWSAVVFAILSFVLYRFRIVSASAYCLNKARLHYREFYASRKVRLFEKLQSMKGGQKFMAVVASVNPFTGQEESEVIWTRASDRAKAMKNLLAGGKLLRVITLSNGDKAEGTKKKLGTFFEDVTQSWLAKEKPKPTPPVRFLTPSTSPATLAAKATVVATPALPEELVVIPEGESITAHDDKIEEPVIPADTVEGTEADVIFSFRKAGDAQIYSQPMTLLCSNEEHPLSRAAKAIVKLRDAKPHLANVKIIPVALVTMGLPGQTGYGHFYFDNTAHVFKALWTTLEKARGIK